MSGVGSYVNISEGNVQTSSPYTLIRDRFDLTQGYADQSFLMTADYVNTLNEAISNIEVPTTAGIGEIDIGEVAFLDYIKRPTFSAIPASPNFPAVPDAPTDYPALPGISDIVVPTMSFSSPSYSDPDKPIAETIAPPGTVPNINYPVLPTAPSITLPDVPIFDDIVLPVAPLIAIPQFDEDIPLLSVDPPSGFSYMESPYNSDIYEVAVEKVLNDIRNGGTGLDVTIEDEIWDRATARQLYEDEKLIRDTETRFAARGFTMPPGALQGALLEAGEQVSRNRTELAGQIAIEQAKLAQTNTHFMVDKGIQIETLLRQFFNDQSNRVLDAAKATVSAGIDIFNAEVEKHNSLISAFNASIAVYEARVKAELAGVDIFKAQIEGAKVQVEVQSTLAGLYEKQVSAVETRMKLFATEVEAMKAMADIEASKIEIFRLETQAYVARLDGEKTKFEIYSAEVGAEKIKAETYASQIAGFLAEVDVAKTRVEVDISRSDAILKETGLLIDKYKAELGGYVAEVDATSKTYTAQITGFEAEVSAYSAETAAEGSYYQAKSVETEAKIKEAELKLRQAIAEIEATLSGYMKLKELQIKGTEGIMGVGAQLAASALNAVNASASYGYSASDSNSESWSHGGSISESHSFDENPT